MESLNLIEMCSDAVPQFLGMFDFSIAPKLLFYAYIPTILVTLVFSTVAMYRDKFSKISVSLFAVALFFSLWLGNEIVQWTAVYHFTILNSWKISMVFESFFFTGLIFLSAYLVKASRFLHLFKFLSLVLPIATIFLIHSPYNISSYDFVNCEGVPGSLWVFFYALQFVMLVGVIFVGQRTLEKTNNKESQYRNRVLYGVVTLFVGFLFINIISEIVGTYTLNIFIPVSMLTCVILFALTAVEYELFSFKFYRSEVLIYSSVALVGSILLIPDPDSQKIVIVGTLLALIFLGRSIASINKRETKHADELDLLNKSLTMLDSKKNEFLSFATHQLRSPLTSIKWGLDSLKTKYDAETVLHLQHTTDDLIGTVNDLLDISKIEQGGMVIKKEELELLDFIGRIVEEFKVVAEKKGLSLSFEFENTPCLIYADGTKLRQVFVNLIDNALKYTKQGSVIVRLGRTNKKVVVSVHDTGPGISKEELGELFDKFLRGAAGKASKSGSGLGLYLAKKIVETHNGTIVALSAGEGKGSEFRVELPL